MTPVGGIRTGVRGRLDERLPLHHGRIKEQFKKGNAKVVFPAALERTSYLNPLIQTPGFYGVTGRTPCAWWYPIRSP